MRNHKSSSLVGISVIGVTIYLLVTSQASSTNAGTILPNIDEPAAHSLLSGDDPAQGREEKTAEQVYKNIVVLKGMPASELNSVMSLMAGSLGVSCTHCHVNPWMSDVKESKQTARKMIQMVMSLNQGNFGGAARVTCYTCHRGQVEPASTLVVTQNSAPKPEAEATVTKPSEPMPSVDDILNRYVQAVGKETIGKLKTRVLRGSQVDTNGMTPPLSRPLEIYMEAPNKLLVITTSRQGPTYEGYNGVAGWFKDGKGQREMSIDELKQIRRDADFYSPINIRQQYSGMVVKGKAMVGDVEAYVIEATNADGKSEKLYFATHTGLLIRREVETKTILGVLPEITDFEDYRDVSGVKEPFTIRSISLPFTTTRKFTEIRHNVPIDNDRFNQPKSK